VVVVVGEVIARPLAHTCLAFMNTRFNDFNCDLGYSICI
jgi:hypothetical protein